MRLIWDAQNVSAHRSSMFNSQNKIFFSVQFVEKHLHIFDGFRRHSKIVRRHRGHMDAWMRGTSGSASNVLRI